MAQHHASGQHAPGDDEPPAKRRSDLNELRGEQLLPKLPQELSHLADRVCVITSARRFERTDFVGGQLLSHEDWVELRESSWELRRIYAMAHFVVLLREGSGVVASLKQAAQAVRLGKEANSTTFTSVHGWVSAYIKNEGKISRRRAVAAMRRHSRS